MSEAYTTRQSKRDSQYAKDYSSWVASLPPDERKRIKAMGLDTPMLCKHGNGAPERDIAESSMASYTPDIAALTDDHQDGRPQGDDCSVGAMAQATRILRHFVADLLKDGNTRLSVECLAVALRLSAYDGESMSAIARRHNITRAAVSKRCVDTTKKLSLPPSRAMRSIKAREIYSRARIQKTKCHDDASCYS